jgi:predicted metal-dependent RNase
MTTKKTTKKEPEIDKIIKIESIRELIEEKKKEREEFIQNINRQIAPQVAAFDSAIQVLEGLIGENGQGDLEDTEE